MSGCSSPEEKLQALKQKYEKLNEKWKQCIKDNDKKCVDETTRKGEELEEEMVKVRKERNKDPQFLKHKEELEKKVDELDKEHDKLEAEVKAMEAKQPNCFDYFDFSHEMTPEERSNCSKANDKQLAPMKDKAYKAFIKRNEAEIELRKFVDE